jgi:nucleoside-diphosphate-sugar epimerase
MNKILITGGSGFIGTNLVSQILRGNFEDVLNIDIKPPKIESHRRYWIENDIRDNKSLSKIIKSFNPNFVVHLAARTDLNGSNIDDYNSNTIGTSNLIDVLKELKGLEKVIFTSSMYVCYPGYNPKNLNDYSPHTVYGKSKVEMEKIIKTTNPTEYHWCITRPTSIWGPWFGEPYANFFEIVISRKYFHFGKKACTKTYGYVDNTVHQIFSLLLAKPEDIHSKVFYLGDWPAYNISEWADEIAECMGITIYQVPFVFFKIAGYFGDLLKIIGIRFPMTSFRLKNMTTDNIHNLLPIQKIAPNLLVDRHEGTQNTINWIQGSKKG